MHPSKRDATLAHAAETLVHCRRYATGDAWATRMALEGVRGVIRELREVEESLAERLETIQRV